MIKSILASKTFWINLIVGALSLLALASPDMLTSLGLNTTKALTIITTVISVLNIILRLLTKSAIAGTTAADSVAK